MQRHDDVIGPLATTRFSPSDGVATSGVTLVCLPGGTYTRRYFDLQIPGHVGYSFAEHMVTLGHAVVSADSLGTGDSERPDAEVGLADQAAAMADLVAHLRQRSEGVRFIAVGHSMGGYVAMLQQAAARSYDAVAILGTTTADVAPLQLPAELIEAADAPEARPALAAHIASTMPHRYIEPDRSPMLNWFHAPDVPPEVMAADTELTSTVVPRQAAAESTVPGFTRVAAGQIDVPVFLAYGAVADVSADPHREPAAFERSNDVTLYLHRGAAHCHNLASTRELLWDRLAKWIG